MDPLKMTTDPIKAEATGQPIAVEFDGVTYAVAPANEWDLDVLEAYEDGRILACVRSLLGAEQYAAFRSKPRNVGDLAALMEAIEEAIGAPGN